MALLTPIAKAYLTDTAFQATLDAQMVFGGHGYIREWGMEQCIRDLRISQIYEGTNGVQSQDLIGRKPLNVAVRTSVNTSKKSVTLRTSWTQT